MISVPGCFLVGCVYSWLTEESKRHHALLPSEYHDLLKKKLFHHLLPLFRLRVKKPRSVCSNPCSVSVGTPSRPCGKSSSRIR